MTQIWSWDEGFLVNYVSYEIGISSNSWRLKYRSTATEKWLKLSITHFLQMCTHIDFRYLRFKEGEKAVVLKMSLKDHCDEEENIGDKETNPDAIWPHAAGRTDVIQFSSNVDLLSQTHVWWQQTGDGQLDGHFFDSYMSPDQAKAEALAQSVCGSCDAIKPNL